ncbi:hypothetical protein LTR62_005073 [Meristemomyces frigidus]|uniref:Apple domain-containing protein n=1 Tax=Meristemomyces frigidus TaxID=1508187 RepID=A0AAN7TI65_9PEZI|nr:hypothetical protein LTR62_005073 [Meristemomyces frigidus]
MIVPDLTGLSSAIDELIVIDTAAAPTNIAATASDVIRKAKGFGRKSRLTAVAHAKATGLNRATEAGKGLLKGLPAKQACASGTSFYACARGFVGCCAVDPCASGECPSLKAGKVVTSGGTTAGNTASADSGPQQLSSSTEETSSNQASRTQTDTSPSTSSATSAFVTAASSANSTTQTASPSSITALATVPACPAANNTLYIDSTNIQYQIHCNADNSQASFNDNTVGTGGYGECFSACSTSTECAGFTYVGLDSGDCYLKSAMPSSLFVQKAGNNYISCAKLNASAASPIPTTSGTGLPRPAGSSKGHTGAIVGGAVGGILGLALVLFLIAALARYRRHKLDNRRASVTHVIHGPLDSHDMTNTYPFTYPSPNNSNKSPAGAGQHHGRSGSTAHDAFAPYGGFYRGFESAHADQRTQGECERAGKGGEVKPDRLPPSLPVYRQIGGNGSVDAVPMLDSTPIERPAAKVSRARAPRFKEDFAEMEDTSCPSPAPPAFPHRPMSPDTDSPTIGRASKVSLHDTTLAGQVRSTQHLMSWNSVEAAQHAGGAHDLETMEGTMTPRSPPTERRAEGFVSPDLSSAPRDGSFVVSPFGSLERRVLPGF